MRAILLLCLAGAADALITSSLPGMLKILSPYVDNTLLSSSLSRFDREEYPCRRRSWWQARIPYSARSQQKHADDEARPPSEISSASSSSDPAVRHISSTRSCRVTTKANLWEVVTQSIPALSIGVVAVALLCVFSDPSPTRAELEPLEKLSYSEQFSSALAPVNTVRGVWRVREARNDGTALPEGGGNGRISKGICKGRLSFKGFVGAGKGTVEYKGCGDREGKGRWLTKPKNIVDGRITLSARWKINFADGSAVIYRGDVISDQDGTPLTASAGGSAARGGQGFERPNAHIRGEVMRPVKGVQGTLAEKKIGDFEADLIELPTDEDKL